MNPGEVTKFSLYTVMHARSHNSGQVTNCSDCYSNEDSTVFMDIRVSGSPVVGSSE